MVHALKTWFARQSLTVKLLVAVPLLVAAILWSLVPGETTPAAGTIASSRPIVSTESTTAAPAIVAPHQEPRPADSGLSWFSALRTIASIGVVVGLIVLSARALKYVMANAGQLPGAGGALKVLETTYLPSPNGRGRAAIHLLEATDGRQLLIGATDTQLSLLAEYEQPNHRPDAWDVRDGLRERGEGDGARRKTVASELETLPGTSPGITPPAGRSAPEPKPAPARFDEVLARLRQSARSLERAG